MNGSGHSHASGQNVGRSQHHPQHNAQAYQQQRMNMHNVAPQAAAQVPVDMAYPTYAYGHPHAHYSYDPASMNLNMRNPAELQGYGYYIPAVSAVPTADVSQLPAHNAVYGVNDQEWAEHVFSSMKQAQAQAQYMGGINLGVGVGGLVTPPHGGYPQSQRQNKRADGNQDGSVADAQLGVSGVSKVDDRSADSIQQQQQSLYYATQMGQMGSYVQYGSTAQDAQVQAQLMNSMNVNHGHGMQPAYISTPLQSYYTAFPAGLGSVFPAPYIDQQNQAFGTVYPAAATAPVSAVTLPVQSSVAPTTAATPAPVAVAQAPAAPTTAPSVTPAAVSVPEIKTVPNHDQSPSVEGKVSPITEGLADLSLNSSHPSTVAAPAPSSTDNLTSSETAAPLPEAQPRKPFSYADALANPARKILPVAPKPAAPAPAPAAVRSGGSPRASAGTGSANARPQSSAVPASQRPPSTSNPAVRRADLPGTNPGPNAFNSSPAKARCFVIKSYSADDIHKSIKYGVWASTEHGNRRLDSAFRECAGTVPVYLFFSVNGSGCFCGMAQMMSAVDYSKAFGAWAQSEKWPGQFKVKWIFIKNLPNREVRHITLPNNSNKPVTNSRDTQEIPIEQSLQLLKVYHSYRHKNSILDDFDYFDQEEEKRKQQPASDAVPAKDGQAADSPTPATAPSAPASAAPAQPAKVASKA